MKFVAELGASHNGSLDRALALIEEIAQFGADAIKIQTWTPDTMDCGGRVLDSGPWAGRSLRDLYRQAHTPWAWHRPIVETATRCGLEWWSTPFDKESVDFLEGLGCPRYKIASFELPDIELIRYAASTGKPMILSTGMASQEEIDLAVYVCSKNHTTLLRCVSAYPANPEDFNLKTLQDMHLDFRCDVGLSDHTKGIVVPVVAATLGATMIERHIKWGDDNGLDDGFASTPQEFGMMCSSVRAAIMSVGRVNYGPGKAEIPSKYLRRSLWWAKTLPEGSIVKEGDVVTARPDEGLHASLMTQVIGSKLECDVTAGTPVDKGDVII